MLAKQYAEQEMASQGLVSTTDDEFENLQSLKS